MIKRGSKEAFKRNMRERPRYVVEHGDGSKHPFKTKKAIIEAYGLNYGRVNQSLNNYFEWFKNNNINIKVRCRGDKGKCDNDEKHNPWTESRQDSPNGKVEKTIKDKISEVPTEELK